MVVGVTIGINVKRISQPAVSLNPEAFIITLQGLMLGRKWVYACCKAPNLLLPVLTGASYERLRLAWLILFAS